MKISTKLLLANIIYTLLVVLLCAGTIVTFTLLNQSIKVTALGYVKTVKTLEELKYSGLRIVSSTVKFVLLINEETGGAESENQKKIEQKLVDEGIKRCYVQMGKYYSLIKEYFPQDSSRYAKVKADLFRLINSSREIIEAKKAEAGKSEIISKKEIFERYESEFLTSVENALLKKELELKENQAGIEESLRKSRNIIIYAVFLSFIVISLIHFLLMKSISAPIKKLKNATLKIREGIYDSSIEAGSNDEIGELSRSFNLMAGKMRETFENLSIEIKERLLAEEKLKKSEIKFRRIVEGTKAILFSTNSRGRFTYLNDAACSMLGMSAEDLIGKFYLRFVYPENRASIHTLLKEQLVNPTPNVSLDVHIISNTGNECWLNLMINPIYEKGNVVGLSSVALDITERKRMEVILKKNADRLRMLNDIGSKIAGTLELNMIMDSAVKLVHQNFRYNHVSLLTYESNGDYVILKAIAGAFVNMFRRDVKIYLEKGMIIWAAQTGNIAVANDVSLDPHYVNVYPDMINTRSELCVPLKIGIRVFGILDIQSPELNAFSEDDINVLVTLADQIALAINNSLLYEAAQQEIFKRKKAEEKLKQIITSKDKLFSVVAHDLKSPFLGLLGYSDYLYDEFDNLGIDEIKEYTGKCRLIVKNLYRLIENLLEWVRLQTGRSPFNPKEILLVNSIKFVSDLLFENANSKKIKILNNINPALVVKADEKMLNSILENLISNSIKFTNPGGEVILSSKESNGMAEIKVSDNGIGMSRKIREQLFDVSLTQTSEGTSGEKGTGLGLLICKEMAERQSGKIWVESEEGKGSAFTFTIPLAV